MTELQTFLGNFYPGQPAFWWAVSGGFVFLLFLLGRHQYRAHFRISTVDNVDPRLADEWLAPAQKEDERRRSLRRVGSPVQVLILDPKSPKKILEGYVVNRSLTGLRIAAPTSWPIGSVINTRSINSHPDSPWVAVIVRNCAAVEDYFEMGCEFQDELPLQLSLSFG